MEDNISAEEQVNLFETEVQYTEATQGQRFLNFLIDNLFMRFILSYATGYAVGYLLLAIAPDFVAEIAYDERGWKFWLLAYILGIFNYVIYYTFCEKAFKGITLGKLLTGTRAIRNDGGELTFKDAMLRSLSRLVPFEPFSALAGTPWHDSWTDTRVVKTR
ncbi:MAG: RDD family protein [Chitinophagaceae bacterium]